MNVARCLRDTRRSARHTARLLAVALVAALLVACGGSSDATPTPSPDPSPAAVDLQLGAAPTPTPQPTATLAPEPTATAIPQRAQSASPPSAPTPLPPPAPSIGSKVSTQGWDITVTDVTTYQRVGDSVANGIFTYVNLTVVNTGSTAAAFPYDGLIVVDANNASYPLTVAATKETLTYDKGVDYFEQFAPGSSHDVAAVFDIALDATGLSLTTPSHAFTILLDYPETTK